MTADLSNWRESPHNVWAFRNVDKVLSTHIVRCSKTPTPLDSESVDPELGSSLASQLKDHLTSTDTDGFIILHHGKIIFEHYAHDNDVSTKHIMMSMTKSITGLVTGILASQGKIDVNAPVKQYVPDASRIYDNVTVQQCLDMLSGVKYNDNSHEYRAAAGWNPLHGDEKAKTLHSFISQVEAETVAPGSYNYCSINTDLVGWVLERATGKRLADLISELLWQPMGAEADAILAIDSEGSPRAAGGLCATVRDIARVGQLLVDRGRGIVPESWINDMLRNGDKEAWNNGAFAPMFNAGYDSIAYRDCWITDEKTKMLCALGIHGQQLMVDLDNSIVMAKTASQPNAVDPGKVIETVKAFKGIWRTL